MILYIDTTENGNIRVALKQGREVLAEKKVKAFRQEAKKLLPAIKKLLKANKYKLSDLEKVEVKNSGGSFTSLRIGVVTANALAYALNIPVIGKQGKIKISRSGKKKFNVVEPLYDREPEITKKKTRKA